MKRWPYVIISIFNIFKHIAFARKELRALNIYFVGAKEPEKDKIVFIIFYGKLFKK